MGPLQPEAAHPENSLACAHASFSFLALDSRTGTDTQSLWGVLRGNTKSMKSGHSSQSHTFCSYGHEISVLCYFRFLYSVTGGADHPEGTVDFNPL